MASLLSSLLFLSYELYYVTLLPSVYHIALILKVSLLAMCFIFGSACLFKKGKYDPAAIFIMAGYIFLTIVSSYFSLSLFYSMSQAIMLLSLLVFLNRVGDEFIDTQKGDIFFKLIILFISTAAFVSCIGNFLIPDKFISFEAGASRLHGIYGEPAHLGTMCGINIGIANYKIKNKIFKIIIISLSLLCIFFTGYRTAIIALVLSAIIMRIISETKFRNIKALSLLVASAFAILIVVKYIDINKIDSRYVRMESVGNLSGRTSIWTIALANSIDKPFGYGFCLGGGAIAGMSNDLALFQGKNKFSLFEHNPGYKAALHNGYIQSLADIGYFGVIFYLLIFAKGIQFVLKNTDNYNSKLYSFILIYLSFCNLTESTVMSPTSSKTLLFYLSWFSLMKYSCENRYSSRIIYK